MANRRNEIDKEIIMEIIAQIMREEAERAEALCDLMCPEPEFDPCEDCEDCTDCEEYAFDLCEGCDGCDDVEGVSDDMEEADINEVVEALKGLTEMVMDIKGMFSINITSRRTEDGQLGSKIEVMGNPSIEEMMRVHVALGAYIHEAIANTLYGTSDKKILSEIAKDILERE